jgi:hypothetical protein
LGADFLTKDRGGENDELADRNGGELFSVRVLENLCGCVNVTELVSDFFCLSRNRIIIDSVLRHRLYSVSH